MKEYEEKVLRFELGDVLFIQFNPLTLAIKLESVYIFRCTKLFSEAFPQIYRIHYKIACYTFVVEPTTLISTDLVP